MSLWSHFWTFAVNWAPPLIALCLCMRSVVSHDSRVRRLVAVMLAFLPTFLPLFGRMWVWWTRAPGGLGGTIYFELIHFLPIVPAIYLVAWAFGSRDARWMRVSSAALGLIGLCFPLFSGWLHLMK